jgi:hypothetical protein
LRYQCITVTVKGHKTPVGYVNCVADVIHKIFLFSRQIQKQRQYVSLPDSDSRERARDGWRRFLVLRRAADSRERARDGWRRAGAADKGHTAHRTPRASSCVIGRCSCTVRITWKQQTGGVPPAAGHTRGTEMDGHGSALERRRRRRRAPTRQHVGTARAAPGKEELPPLNASAQWPSSTPATCSTAA